MSFEPVAGLATGVGCFTSGGGRCGGFMGCGTVLAPDVIARFGKRRIYVQELQEGACIIPVGIRQAVARDVAGRQLYPKRLGTGLFQTVK